MDEAEKLAIHESCRLNVAWIAILQQGTREQNPVESEDANTTLPGALDE